jgi:hypothetical protein
MAAGTLGQQNATKVELLERLALAEVNLKKRKGKKATKRVKLLQELKSKIENGPDDVGVSFSFESSPTSCWVPFYSRNKQKEADILLDLQLSDALNCFQSEKCVPCTYDEATNTTLDTACSESYHKGLSPQASTQTEEDSIDNHGRKMDEEGPMEICITEKQRMPTQTEITAQRSDSIRNKKSCFAHYDLANKKETIENTVIHAPYNPEHDRGRSSRGPPRVKSSVRFFDVEPSTEDRLSHAYSLLANARHLQKKY